MGCGVYWQQVHEVERALSVMERYGVSPTDPGYLSVQKQRASLVAQIGQKFPRTFFQVAKSFGMSPGVITLWEDVESGWLAEARVRPGAPPVYHYVEDEVAMAILKREVTPEMREYLFAPDPYIGE